MTPTHPLFAVITRDQVRTALSDRKPTALVDVSGCDSYMQGHLPGAHDVTLDDRFDKGIQEMATDRDQQVIVYGRDHDDRTPHRAAERLDALGYRKVAVYEGGKADWAGADLPLDSTPTRAA